MPKVVMPTKNTVMREVQVYSCGHEGCEYSHVKQSLVAKHFLEEHILKSSLIKKIKWGKGIMTLIFIEDKELFDLIKKCRGGYYVAYGRKWEKPTWYSILNDYITDLHSIRELIQNEEGDIEDCNESIKELQITIQESNEFIALLEQLRDTNFDETIKA